MAFALVFILGSFVVYFELTQPAYENLQKTIGERNGYNKFLAEQKPAVNNVLKLIDNYTGDSAGNLRNALSATLPLGPDLSSSLVQLEGLVRLSGLSLQNITPEVNRSALIPSTKPLVKPVGTLTFRVAFTGSYNQVKDFFSRIENNVLLMEIRSANLQPLGAKAGVDLFTGTAEVVSYYQQM
mgnify:CR=1 FL=1